jgi:hypothetical protein
VEADEHMELTREITLPATAEEVWRSLEEPAWLGEDASIERFEPRLGIPGVLFEIRLIHQHPGADGEHEQEPAATHQQDKKLRDTHDRYVLIRAFNCRRPESSGVDINREIG